MFDGGCWENPTCRCRATSGVEKRSLLILNGHLNASHVPAAGAVG